MAGLRRPDRRLSRRGGAVELLRVPAFLYGVVTDLRGRLYERGWLPTGRLDVPVVSVGNLTAGGTGKTPMVAFLARELVRRGWRPGVLSRGYGARDGENDEAKVLAALLPDVPRVQNPDRIEGGRALVEEGCEVIVMDDGFQHRRLVRDLDLVLVDATRPWGLPVDPPGTRPVRALLPRGLLREHPEGIDRADVIVLTRTDLVDAGRISALRHELGMLAPGKPILHGAHRPISVLQPDGTARAPQILAGRRVDLVSALGNPEGFEACVRALGAEVDTHRTFPDHHLYSQDDLDGLGENGRWIVTTAKDAVKLAHERVHVLEVEFSVEEGASVLDALLEALPQGRARVERRSLHEGLHG